MSRLEIFGIEGLPEIRPGDDVAGMITDAAGVDARTVLADRDVVVVTQKIVSKAEDRLVPIDASDPLSHKPLVERESVRVLRRRGELMISETVHGFVCANAGIDLSNVEHGFAALLPVDSDRSARRLRDGLRARAGVDVGVIVSDTFGRPWRRGVTDVAIGCAGIAAVVDLRGTSDALGREMQVTEVALADEIAAAAELVMGKSTNIPVAVVRGLDAGWFRTSSIKDEMIRHPDEDLFRETKSNGGEAVPYIAIVPAVVVVLLLILFLPVGRKGSRRSLYRRRHERRHPTQKRDAHRQKRVQAAREVRHEQERKRREV